MDVNLSNSIRNFHDACTLKTGLLDFHKLIIFVLKLYFPNKKCIFKPFKASKRFQNNPFRSELDYELHRI